MSAFYDLRNELFREVMCSSAPIKAEPKDGDKADMDLQCDLLDNLTKDAGVRSTLREMAHG